MAWRWTLLAGLVACAPRLDGDWTGHCEVSDGRIELTLELTPIDNHDSGSLIDGEADWPDGASTTVRGEIWRCTGASVCHAPLGDMVQGEAIVDLDLDEMGVYTVADLRGRRVVGDCNQPGGLYGAELVLRKPTF